MTEKATDVPAPDAATPETPSPTSANNLSGKNKAFWAGVGIGSAAIVAAVMYTRRPKKTRR